jgi:stage II sporulation protein AA (anti-sigma F factor antagonist)
LLPHELPHRIVYPDDGEAPDRIEVFHPGASLAIAELIGEHDLGQYESLKTALLRAAVRASDVVVDLSRCTFMDSTVINILLHAQHVVALHHGNFAVVLPSEQGPVARVADMMRLADLLPLHLSRESALASLPATSAQASHGR